MGSWRKIFLEFSLKGGYICKDMGYDYCCEDGGERGKWVLFCVVYGRVRIINFMLIGEEFD